MPLSTNTLFFSFFYFLSIRFMLSSAVSTSNATDALALLAFKAAIDSDPLNALTSWNQTIHVCSWKGVTCGRRHRDRVVSINLMSQGLVGSLSPCIGNLSFLRTITLQNNSFHGQIPQEIGHLSRLRYLKLRNNSFSGEIPKNLSQCLNLYYLDLIDNNLIGTIIPELSRLVKLNVLGLSLNRFSGTIPSWIGNLTHLVKLSLRDCGLVGQIPESLAQLQNLGVLILSENNLRGTIPPQLFNSSIFLITLANNMLQGAIPSDIGFSLPNLQWLYLYNNKFSGEIPVSLSNASSLEQIALSNNTLTGSILHNYERLTNLQKLILSNNNFIGDISFISSLINCTKLTTFDASENLLNGSLPNSIANLSKTLILFDIEGNQLHGRVPPGIGDLLNLRYLLLGQNNFSGPIPSSIGKLVELQLLDIEGNRFTGNVPPSLDNLTMLNQLFASYNNISGSIPQTFGNLRNLLALGLSHNNLSGSIPGEVLSLSSISIFLHLDNNELTGPIPSEVGLLRNLGRLYLSNNRLSGFIPEAMSSCMSLEHLHLQGNSFQGEIPAGLGALKGLEELDLSQNHLSGKIPSFLGGLHLLNLNLSFNNFQGEVPTSGVFQNKSAISIEGNVGLCGGIHELRLQSCPTSNDSKRRGLPKVLKTVLPIGGLGVICSILMLFICVVMYKRRMRQKPDTSIPFVDGQVTRLSYDNLLKATTGFSEANLIGAGRFGSVYKGSLDDGKTMMAVKILNLDVRGASKTFLAECNALREIRHRNLIKLLSVCVGIDFQGQDFKALVYEFKSNGNLEKWLHQNNVGEEGDETRNLTVIERLNIAIDIASALEYLQYGINSTIVHGDLKPSNILLDKDMTAYLGDFGLARVVSSMSKDLLAGESSSIAIKGTIGYIAPEYGMGDPVTTQGDVYSFGILILEMFTNIRPTDNTFTGHDNLHDFVSTTMPDNMPDILDPSIFQETGIHWDNKAQECVLSVLRIGVACSNDVPRDRMAMTDAITDLIRIRNVYLAARRS